MFFFAPQLTNLFHILTFSEKWCKIPRTLQLQIFLITTGKLWEEIYLGKREDMKILYSWVFFPPLL